MAARKADPLYAEMDNELLDALHAWQDTAQAREAACQAETTARTRLVTALKAAGISGFSL
jgi:hypothetical protein